MTGYLLAALALAAGTIAILVALLRASRRGAAAARTVAARTQTAADDRERVLRAAVATAQQEAQAERDAARALRSELAAIEAAREADSAAAREAGRAVVGADDAALAGMFRAGPG